MFDPIAYINEPRWMESRLGLERIVALLERLGRPQDQLKFVHVAGTNGKGSTCAYLASVLREAGYCTGLFTSPYIVEFEERIRVDGCNISAEQLAEATLKVREQAEAMADHPTEFELMTAVALIHFVQQSCDMVVLEVGLGGRFDSTNVIDVAEVAVIARIGLDHTNLLGNTLAAIATEKSGIIKPHVPVVSWPQEPEAREVVAQAARTNKSTLVMPDFSRLEVMAVEWSMPPQRTFSYGAYRNLSTNLLGSYQPSNAVLAIEAILALRRGGWEISDEAIRRGIALTKWPGRFEIVQSGKGRPTVVVDGAHNPQGAQALAASLADVFPGKKPIFIMGVLEDKNYPEMIEALLPLGEAFITVAPDNPRALTADKLARAIRWAAQDLWGCSACINPVAARSMEDALAKACSLAGAEGLVCVFGSLYSLAECKTVFASSH